MSMPSSQRVPGPPGNLFLGNWSGFRDDILTTITDAHRQYGDLVRFRVGLRDIYVACDPGGAEEILVNQKSTFGKLSGSSRGDSIAIMLGNGLLTSRGHFWNRQRHMMQPIFHKNNIARMTEKITSAGVRMLERWSSFSPSGQIVDVADEMARLTLDVISQTLFSADVAKDAMRIKEALDVTTKYVFERVKNPIMAPLSWPTKKNRRFRRALSELDRVVYRIIERRGKGGVGEPDLLDMLLAARDPETDERMDSVQLRDEVATIFFAGHETTAAALSWTWFLLAKNPDCLSRIQSEVDSIVLGNAPVYDDVEKLRYVRASFEESMRLYPPGPLIVRAAYQDGSLDGYRIPAGSRVLVNIYNIHRHPEFWSSPDDFHPERFIEGNYDRKAYLPFSTGQRMCIGNHLATTEAVMLIAQIAKSFVLQLDLSEVVEPEAAVTLRPKNGLKMLIRKRRPIQNYSAMLLGVGIGLFSGACGNLLRNL